jgi:hypothetical protein
MDDRLLELHYKIEKKSLDAGSLGPPRSISVFMFMGGGHQNHTTGGGMGVAKVIGRDNEGLPL